MGKHGANASSVVLADADLLGCILQFAELRPVDLVAVGRVSKAWRAAIHSDAALLLSVANRPRFLTKSTFCGLFALSPREADSFPRHVAPRVKGGLMFMYDGSAISAVLPTTGGLEGWRHRLARRAVEQVSLERAFGADWRMLCKLQWGPARSVVGHQIGSREEWLTSRRV